MPLGQFQSVTAYRKSLTGLIQASAMFYWNISRAQAERPEPYGVTAAAPDCRPHLFRSMHCKPARSSHPMASSIFSIQWCTWCSSRVRMSASAYRMPKAATLGMSFHKARVECIAKVNRRPFWMKRCRGRAAS